RGFFQLEGMHRGLTHRRYPKAVETLFLDSDQLNTLSNPCPTRAAVPHRWPNGGSTRVSRRPTRRRIRLLAGADDVERLWAQACSHRCPACRVVTITVLG